MNAAFEAVAAAALREEAELTAYVLREMATGFHAIGMTVAAHLCTEKAAAIEVSA